MSGVPVQVHQVADAVACIVNLYGLSSGVANASNASNHLHVPGTLSHINRLLCSQALKCSKHALLS